MNRKGNKTRKKERITYKDLKTRYPENMQTYDEVKNKEFVMDVYKKRFIHIFSMMETRITAWVYKIIMFAGSFRAIIITKK